jgi:hypothetical protein
LRKRGEGERAGLTTLKSTLTSLPSIPRPPTGAPDIHLLHAAKELKKKQIKTMPTNKPKKKEQRKR